MSLETLKADLKANISEAKKLSGMSTMQDIVDHLNNVLWPTMEAAVDELDEIDRVMEDVVHGAPEILHAESGAVFSAVVTGAVFVAGALKTKITKESDPALYKAIEELEANCKEANAILDEIVLEDDEEDEEVEDDEDLDEDDDTEGDE